MKAFLFSLCLLSFTVHAQDPANYLKSFDSKVYSLKSKGVNDFVVDIESTKLTKQMNDQMIFGKIDRIIFKIYWTANPERLAVEIDGLPEGFKEIKEELKASILGLMDSLLPLTFAQKFPGYKFIQGTAPKEIVAQDSQGLGEIPTFVIKFDAQDKLVEILGRKMIGEYVVTPTYAKESFATDKWVLKSLVTKNIDQGKSVTVKKDLSYGDSQGIGVLTEVSTTTEQKNLSGKSKPISSSEEVTFKNYKINAGEALKYFLGNGQPETDKSKAE